MAIKFLVFVFVFLALLCTVGFFYKLKTEKSKLSLSEASKLFGSGILAFIADTIGVGSFAVNTALAKILGTAQDFEIPALNNGAQVIPGTLSALFFITYVDVDISTLYTLVIGTCVGGIIGGAIVSRLNKQSICLTMMICFSIIAALLVLRKLNLLSVGGTANSLESWKLVVGFLGMVLSGVLSSAGVGLFALVQGILFLLNMSPIVAFPIMMAAGAMQQPLTTMMFLKQNKIPVKKTLILSVGGCIGVLLVVPIFQHITISWLHYLLLGVLIFNVLAISKTYFKDKNKEEIILESVAN